MMINFNPFAAVKPWDYYARQAKHGQPTNSVLKVIAFLQRHLISIITFGMEV